MRGGREPSPKASVTVHSAILIKADMQGGERTFTSYTPTLCRAWSFGPGTPPSSDMCVRVRGPFFKGNDCAIVHGEITTDDMILVNADTNRLRVKSNWRIITCA